MPVSTTAHTMPLPKALNDRRAASALTVTQEASTCSCTGKSGQTRWMLRSGQATGAASAETSRSTWRMDRLPVAYWSATCWGVPPDTRTHSRSRRAKAARGPPANWRFTSAITGIGTSSSPEKPICSRAFGARSGAAITPATSRGSVGSVGVPGPETPGSAGALASCAATAARRPAAVSVSGSVARISRADRRAASAARTWPCQRGLVAFTA